MKTLSSSVSDCPAQNMRFITLSATIPNMDDIAEWLGAPEKGILRFGEEFRPVKLEYKVLGFYPAKNDFLFDKTLNYKIFEVVKTHYNRKSTLIVTKESFCFLIKLVLQL
jgi:ATP-dependent DNA helicase HFM1/MER3